MKFPKTWLKLFIFTLASQSAMAELPFTINADSFTYAESGAELKANGAVEAVKLNYDPLPNLYLLITVSLILLIIAPLISAYSIKIALTK